MRWKSLRVSGDQLEEGHLDHHEWSGQEGVGDQSEDDPPNGEVIAVQNEFTEQPGETCCKRRFIHAVMDFEKNRGLSKVCRFK